MSAPADRRVAAGARSDTGSPGPGRPPWWTGAVGYQVYLRSFCDSSGDGVGDLQGLQRRLPYIADLGVDYVWITPFYPSPQADHGYDVADYTDVDPIFGTLADFDAVVAEGHRLGLRIVVDVVPNHTSDQHPWFRDATTSRHADRRHYYVWADPGPDGGPPNNWVSKFGGPAWTWHEATGQYYMHTFLAEQPDLNWAHDDVRREFEAILRFWLDRGVDGFRVDTAHLLTEDPQLRDNPQVTRPAQGAEPQVVYESFDHRHDLDQPDVVDIYRRWHEVLAPYGAMLLGEVYLLQPERVRRYVQDGALDLAFWFPALKAEWDADAIRSALVDAVQVGGDRFVWPLSSHDDPRATHRFGGGRQGVRRSLAYLTLLAGLPGAPCLLQGDELALHAVAVPGAHARDPVATRNPGAAGRDASRTPMPWEPGAAFGFTSGTPWLPFPEGTSDGDTVARQSAAPDSPLQHTRRLLAARRRLPDLEPGVPVQWMTQDGPLVAYRRGGVVVALNTGDAAAPVPLPAAARVVHASGSVAADGARVVIPADAAAMLQLTPTAAP